MSQPPDAFLLVNGWTIFSHPLFLDQIDVLLRQVEAFRQKDPTSYVRKNASKRLAAITKLAFEIIPQDPGRVEYRQGNALCEEHKHWFRAKFFQQYRLFSVTTHKARSLFMPGLMMKIQNALTRVGMMPIVCSTRC